MVLLICSCSRVHADSFQVGIVRQTETAAIKKAEGSRGTFDRKLTAVYTSATLEASCANACSMHSASGDSVLQYQLARTRLLAFC